MSVINQALIDRVLYQRKNGVSLRGIARNEKVSMTTVRRIVLGNYNKEKYSENGIVQRLKKIAGYKITPGTPTGVCPLCHNKVTMPCKACLIKMYNAMTNDPVQIDFDTITDDEAIGLIMESETPVLGVDLKHEDYERYIKIKEQKDREREERELEEDL